jgi:hypothetical protein
MTSRDGRCNQEDVVIVGGGGCEFFTLLPKHFLQVCVQKVTVIIKGVGSDVHAWQL